MTEKDIEVISELVLQHIRPIRGTRRQEAVTETVTREEEVVERVPFEYAVDVGVHPVVITCWGIANVIGIGLLLTAPPLLGVVGLLIANGGGFWGYRNFRRTKHETRYGEVEKTRTITEEVEVEPEKTVEWMEDSSHRVVAVGKGHIRFETVGTKYGTLLLGPSSASTSHEVALPLPARADVVRSTHASLRDELEALPWVLDGEQSFYSLDESTKYGEQVPLRGLEASMRDHFSVTAEQFSDLHYPSFTLNSVTDANLPDRLVLLSENGESEREHATPPLTGILNGCNGTALESFASEWLSYWSYVQGVLFSSRWVSLCEHLAPQCFDLGNQLSYSAFNFYCPTCNANEREDLVERNYSIHEEDTLEPVYFSPNTRCVYQPDAGNERWSCTVCGDTTSHPIPIHKTLDEILLPAYDQLMSEHKVERLNLHRNTRDKEQDLYHGMQSEVGRIQYNEMSELLALVEQMEQFKADISGEEEAIASMEDLLATYAVEQDDVMRTIAAFSKDVQKDITERTSRVVEEMDRVKKKEMEALDKRLSQLSKAKRLEDERRDSIQREILQSNERQEAHIQENTAAQRETTEAVKENTAATREQTLVLGQKIQDVNNSVKEGNAIQSAVAKHNEIDLHDESPMLKPITYMSNKGKDVIGFVSGEATYKTEARKLN